MATHFWILPWFSLIAFAVAFLVSSIRHRSNSSSDAKVLLPGPSYWAILAIAIATTSLALLKIGALIGEDYVPARGLLLGAIGGIAIAVAPRLLNVNNSHSIEVSLVGLLVVVGRLWLTHGELSGLTSLVIGLILALVCLKPIEEFSESAYAVVLATILALTSAIGFTRAEDVIDSYWADVPLVIAGLFALIIASMPGKKSVLSATIISVLMIGISFLIYRQTAQTLAPAAAFALGLAIVGVQMGLDKPDSSRFGRYVGVALTIAGVTASFLLAAGYGVALFALGGVVTLFFGMDASSEPNVHNMPLGCVAFTAAFIAYRLALLIAGEPVRSNGPGDIWDMIALGLGIIGIYLAGSLLPSQKQIPAIDAWSKIEYVFACIVPVTVLAYLWQPRAFAGLFVGTALAPLLYGAIGQNTADDDLSKIAFTSLLISAMLLEIMPLLGEVAKPTRAVRIGLVLLLVFLAIVRAIVAGRFLPRPTAHVAEAQE